MDRVAAGTANAWQVQALCHTFSVGIPRGNNLIYGSVVFNLTFFHEVLRTNETLYSMYAKFIDSCIDIIVSRPVIQEHHLVHGIVKLFSNSYKFIHFIEGQIDGDINNIY